MKNFMWFIPLCMLVACDLQKTPDCWDKEIQQVLLSDTTYTVWNNDTSSPDFNKPTVYKAVKVSDIVEVPVDGAKLCNVKITFSDAKTRNFKYQPVYVKTQNGKKARVMNFEEY